MDYPIGHPGDIQSASPAVQQPTTERGWGDVGMKTRTVVSPIDSQNSEDVVACSICQGTDPVMFALEVLSMYLQWL